MVRDRGNVQAMAGQQMTQPRGKDDDGKPAEPIEIPIPAKRDVLRDLAKTARPKGERKLRKRQRSV